MTSILVGFTGVPADEAAASALAKHLFSCLDLWLAGARELEDSASTDTLHACRYKNATRALNTGDRSPERQPGARGSTRTSLLERDAARAAAETGLAGPATGPVRAAERSPATIREAAGATAFIVLALCGVLRSEKRGLVPRPAARGTKTREPGNLQRNRKEDEWEAQDAKRSPLEAQRGRSRQHVAAAIDFTPPCRVGWELPRRRFAGSSPGGRRAAKCAPCGS